jgi:hypothetical protein
MDYRAVIRTEHPDQERNALLTVASQQQLPWLARKASNGNDGVLTRFAWLLQHHLGSGTNRQHAVSAA